MVANDQIKYIQQVVGTLMFYAHAIEATMLVALTTISQQQSKSTQSTINALNQLMDYCHTHPNAILIFYASDMVLKVHTDASYLSEQNARSRIAGHFYLGNKPLLKMCNNGAVLNVSTILKVVVSSAAEAEYGGIFHNAKLAVPMRTTLEELGHIQQQTPICTDNSTAAGIANKIVKQKRSRAMDMGYHWIQDRIKQRQFLVHWKPGQMNKADYFSKHHIPGHHKLMRPHYLQCN